MGGVYAHSSAANSPNAISAVKPSGKTDEEEDEGGVVGRQRWALEAVCSFVTRQRASIPCAVLEAVVAWLMQSAFFAPAALKAAKKGTKAAVAHDKASEVPAAVRQVCGARFFGLIEALSARTTAPAPEGGSAGRARPAVVLTKLDKLPSELLQALELVSPKCVELATKTAGMAQEAGLDTTDAQLFWPLRAHLIWKALEAAGVAALVQWDPTMSEVRTNFWNTTIELVRSSGNDASEVLHKRQSRALAVLFLYNGLELLSDPEAAVNVVLELQQCHTRVLALRLGSTKPKPASSKKKVAPKAKRQVEPPLGEEEDDEEEEESEDEVMSVLVELLVSLLARPSAVLRSVVKSTFRAFCDSITPSTVEVLVQVLSSSGADLFGGGEGDDDDDMQQDAQDDDDENLDDDESDDEEQVAAALSTKGKGGKSKDAKVSKDAKPAKGALASKRKAPDDEDSGADEEEESDGESDGSGPDSDDWDDDKMFAIDHLVAAAFKSRLEETRVAKQTSSMSLVLKLRTLELVEVLLSRKDASSIVLLLVEPLLDLAISGGSGDKKMGESAQQRVSFHAKVSSLYADKLCRLRPAPAVTSASQASEVVAMVERLCERMVAHGELAASGITFLLRVLSASSQVHGSALESGLIHVGGMLDKWAAKKHTKLNPLFFSQLFERQATIAWALAPQVVKHAQAAPSDFQRTTCLEMLLTLARQTGVLKQHPHLLPHARTMLQEVPAALEAAAAQASEHDGSSKKVTKMVQAALAVGLKCVELEEQLKTGLFDHAKVASVAAQVETSETALRAKSVQHAAMRLKLKCSTHASGASKTPKAKLQQHAERGTSLKSATKGSGVKGIAVKGSGVKGSAVKKSKQ